MEPSVHIPVLLAEILAWLNPRPGQCYADGTLGGGGHARALAERVAPDGSVLAVDRDAAAVERATQFLRGLPIQVAQGSYAELPALLAEVGRPAVSGILLDLGLSSDQLADRARGFSFDSDGELDLRFDQTRGEPAWRLIMRLPERELANVIYQYGEERHSRRIARLLVEQRRHMELRTSQQLAQILRRAVPRSPRDKIDPATRTFQALRIAVNDELGELDKALALLPDCLLPGGRLAIISFHSLEDRRVKEAFRSDPRLQNLTKKPITADEPELALNPRSRSAKLRVAERRPPAI
ncbi:MAG: 16S rRNA (cytosine(1402)-N(4))-methyltransferase RsmH [Pirellulales bacterium]|nr:16S rRNA (cytosine(1402)-N(4))-methyltransferase RsmH [Pirellulales bacterium]